MLKKETLTFFRMRISQELRNQTKAFGSELIAIFTSIVAKVRKNDISAFPLS